MKLKYSKFELHLLPKLLCRRIRVIKKRLWRHSFLYLRPLSIVMHRTIIVQCAIAASIHTVDGVPAVCAGCPGKWGRGEGVEEIIQRPGHDNIVVDTRYPGYDNSTITNTYGMEIIVWKGNLNNYISYYDEHKIYYSFSVLDYVISLGWIESYLVNTHTHTHTHTLTDRHTNTQSHKSPKRLLSINTWNTESC